MPNPYVDGIQNGSTTIDIYDKELRESLGTASTYDVPESGDASDNEVVKGDDTRLGNIKGNNTVLTTDKTPFLIRQTLNPTGFSGYVREKLIGASYAWNQLVDKIKLGSSGSSRGITMTNNGDGSLSFTGTGDNTGMPNFVVTNDTTSYIPNHVYLLQGCPKGGSSSTYYLADTDNYVSDYGDGVLVKPSSAHTFISALRIRFGITYAISGTLKFWVQLTDLTLAFGSTIADYLYSLTNNGGITKLRDMGFPIDKYTPYGYGLYSVKTSGKKIVGKNKNDNSNNVTGGYYESNGTWQASNDYATSGLIPVLPNTTYVGSMFDKNGNNRDSVVYTLWSDSTTCQGGYTTSTITTLSDTKFVRIRNYQRSASYITAKNFVFQLEIGSTNTAFEEYSCTTYSLGNDELRGKFDLVNGEIVASGDVKESNGGITRNYKLIDLGSVEWTYFGSGDNVRFLTQSAISDIKAPSNNEVPKAVCANYTVMAYTPAFSTNKSFAIYSDGKLFVKDFSYTDATTFKNAMNGVYAIVELATPTTEQSTPFADPMSMVGATTEEYIDTRDIPCPVGAERQYMGESNDVIPIPSSPMSDGKWVQKNYVSGGKQQIVWEEDTDEQNNAYEYVDLTSSAYEFPCDGYIVVDSQAVSSGSVRVQLTGNNGTFVIGGIYMNITGQYQVQTVFVKKGMKARVVMDVANTRKRFIPLV